MKHAFVLVALLFGCASAPHYASINGPQGAIRMDEDGDGVYGPWVCPVGVSGCDAQSLNAQPIAQLDCDDHDPRRYPGAPDPEGDGIDQNCDGIDGLQAPAAPPPSPAQPRD